MLETMICWAEKVKISMTYKRDSHVDFPGSYPVGGRDVTLRKSYDTPITRLKDDPPINTVTKMTMRVLRTFQGIP
jgi:hypothetical protein